MNKSVRSILFGIAVISFAPVAIAAGTGSEGFFEIHNNSQGNTVVGFYTNDGGGWSANWLADRIEGSQSALARFEADTGSCDQILRVAWLGDDLTSEVLDEPITINICEATNIYLGDNEITYD